MYVCKLTLCFVDIPLAPILEGIVLLRKNPEYMEEDIE
jgi:hypothetical protein